MLELKDQVTNQESQVQNEDEKLYPPEELKRILENMQNDLPTFVEDDITHKFKYYEEIKKDLGDINLYMKTDAELLQKLTSNYKNIISNNTFSTEIKNDEILNVLQDIEYLVHQIDNANIFIKTGGFDEIIYKNLNSTNVPIKSEVLKILGACVQNNVKVQIHALETGAVEKVTRLLALETNDDVKLRAIYSMSSLLRRFPLAQKQFVKNGGLNIFSNIFKTSNMKLQLKIITLMYDLLIEHKEAMEYTEHPDFIEKRKQYMLVDLDHNLIKNGWCEIFNNALVNNLSIDDVDHDAIERCLNIIFLMIDSCREQFSSSKLLTYLKKLKSIYESLESEDLETAYFSHLKDLTHNAITIIAHNYKSEL